MFKEEIIKQKKKYIDLFSEYYHHDSSHSLIECKKTLQYMDLAIDKDKEWNEFLFIDAYNSAVLVWYCKENIHNILEEIDSNKIYFFNNMPEPEKKELDDFVSIIASQEIPNILS